MHHPSPRNVYRQDTGHPAPGRYRIRPHIQFFAITLLGMLALPGMAEQRLAYSADAPAWLRAVGKLHVPGSRVEDGRR